MATKRTLTQVEQALREKTREVDVLHRISESISNTLDLEAVLRHIVDMVVEVTKADACLLYLLSDNRDELILRASKNPHPKLIGRITIGMGEGITGWVARERTRVVIPNSASDDTRFKFFHNLPEDRYQAFVSVPITTKQEVVGVINVQHKRSRRYRPDELALLSTIATQVGGAIENARLYDQMTRRGRRKRGQRAVPGLGDRVVESIDRGRAAVDCDDDGSNDGIEDLLHHSSGSADR